MSDLTAGLWCMGVSQLASLSDASGRRVMWRLAHPLARASLRGSGEHRAT